MIEESIDAADVKSRVGKILDDLNKTYYWEEHDFVSTWQGMNSDEKELLLEARCKNAELALKTLEKHQEGLLEHRPLEIFGAKVLPDIVYKKNFLRKELRKL